MSLLSLPMLVTKMLDWIEHFLAFRLDLPKGPIKNNSMRKLAAKTLMEILPKEITSKVQARLEEQATNPDFVTLMGLFSFYGA